MRCSPLERFCLARGYIIDEVIEEIGGGLNYTRPQFLRLMTMIENQQIGILVIAFKDKYLSKINYTFR